MPTFGERSKQDRFEIPVGLAYQQNDEGERRPSLRDDTSLYDSQRLPINQYQALMEADFLEEPALDQETAQALWEAFQDKIERAALTDHERVVVDCIVFGGMSLSVTGEYLARHVGTNTAFGKQRIARIRDKAYEKLRAVFQEETE